MTGVTTAQTWKRKMAFRVRSSKYRHVFGRAAKKEHCYECIKISKNAHDSNCCAVNPKYIAIVTEAAGGGSFVVLSLEKTGRIDINSPKVCGHSGQVLDIKWNPFNDDVIASCSDDATVKVWQIPADGLHANLSEWIVDLHGHQRRVGYIEWHPTAENILLSAAYDFRVILWNTETAEPINVITVHTDTIFSIAWNRDGSLFATTCKDKMIRVFDARDGNVIAEGVGHQGSKASKVLFLGEADRIFTTGFCRMSERQYAVWDTNNMSKPLKMETIDSSSGVLLPYYDYDTRIMFLAGKGDGNIRYFEMVNESPYCHFLSQYQSGSPQRSLGAMPKRGVDSNRCEIVRFYKLHTSKDLVEPISMIVPRKSEIFQEDIFPPTASACPSLTANEWLSGQNRDPILISLKDGALCHAPTITTYRAVKRTSQEKTHHGSHKRAPPSSAMKVAPPVAAEKLPASVRNIKKLSEDNVQLDDSAVRRLAGIDRSQSDVGNRINVFEKRSSPSPPPPPTTRLSNANQPIKVDKKIWASGYASPSSNEVAVSNGPANESPAAVPFTFHHHHQAAALSRTPSGRPAGRADGGDSPAGTPFFTAVKAPPRKSSYPGSPSDFASPVRGMLFSSEGRSEEGLFRTPPSSPRRRAPASSPPWHTDAVASPQLSSTARRLAAAAATAEKWNQNPLYGAEPPDESADLGVVYPPTVGGQSPCPARRHPPALSPGGPPVRSPARPLTVDTTQLDAILQDMEWSAQPPPKVCISPLSRHNVDNPFCDAPPRGRPDSYPGVGGVGARRHSLCDPPDPDQPAWMLPEAPDDTLLKPSKLRESARNRRAHSADKENVGAGTGAGAGMGAGAGAGGGDAVAFAPVTQRRFASSENLLRRSVSDAVCTQPAAATPRSTDRTKPKVRRTANRTRKVSVADSTSDDDSQKVHVRKVWSAHRPSHDDPPRLNGCPNTDPELRKAYFRQVDEIRSLKERLSLKDKRIWQLEEELRLLAAADDDSG